MPAFCASCGYGRIQRKPCRSPEDRLRYVPHSPDPYEEKVQTPMLTAEKPLRKSLDFVTVALWLAVFWLATSAAAAQTPARPWMDQTLSASERAALVLA